MDDFLESAEISAEINVEMTKLERLSYEIRLDKEKRKRFTKGMNRVQRIYLTQLRKLRESLDGMD